MAFEAEDSRQSKGGDSVVLTPVPRRAGPRRGTRQHGLRIPKVYEVDTTTPGSGFVHFRKCVDLPRLARM